jgi:hypothetical protein
MDEPETDAFVDPSRIVLMFFPQEYTPVPMLVRWSDQDSVRFWEPEAESDQQEV